MLDHPQRLGDLGARHARHLGLCREQGRRARDGAGDGLRTFAARHPRQRGRARRDPHADLGAGDRHARKPRRHSRRGSAALRRSAISASPKISPRPCCSSLQMMPLISRARNCSSTAAPLHLPPARRSIADNAGSHFEKCEFRPASAGRIRNLVVAVGSVAPGTYFEGGACRIEPLSQMRTLLGGRGIFYDTINWRARHAYSRSRFCSHPGFEHCFQQIRLQSIRFDRSVFRNWPVCLARRRHSRRAGRLVLIFRASHQRHQPAGFQVGGRCNFHLRGLQSGHGLERARQRLFAMLGSGLHAIG